MDRLDIDKKRAIELGVCYVGTHWKLLTENQVELSILSGGYSSRLFIVKDVSTSTANPIKTFLVRLYGGKMLAENDPLKSADWEIKEALMFYAMGTAKLGPKLYGTFDGGRVEEFVPSHRLSAVDFDQRPETMFELARKLARFHSLDLPISKERHHILDVCQFYCEQRNLEQLRQLANHVGIADISNFERFDIKLEIEWLKRVEMQVGGRIVTISGDVHKNNILVRDEPDEFGERVMVIDYELCVRDFRGRDVGQVFIMKTWEMNDGYFDVCCEYPDETWRRSFLTEYLKETKSLNYFEWDEKLDGIVHLMMEADFFMLYSVHLVVGFFTNVKSDSPYYQMPADKVRSLLNIVSHMIDVYWSRKSYFIETYGNQLDLSD